MPFQNAATAVTNLYKGKKKQQQLCTEFVCFYETPTLKILVVFMLFATMVESVEAHQRSFDRGIQIGHQRRNKVSD